MAAGPPHNPTTHAWPGGPPIGWVEAQLQQPLREPSPLTSEQSDAMDRQREEEEARRETAARSQLEAARDFADLHRAARLPSSTNMPVLPYAEAWARIVKTTGVPPTHESVTFAVRRARNGFRLRDRFDEHARTALWVAPKAITTSCYPQPAAAQFAPFTGFFDASGALFACDTRTRATCPYGQHTTAVVPYGTALRGARIAPGAKLVWLDGASQAPIAVHAPVADYAQALAFATER